MRSNQRLQRILTIRQPGGVKSVAIACAAPEPYPVLSDLKLFALTFAGGFLFTTVFIA